VCVCVCVHFNIQRGRIIHTGTKKVLSTIHGTWLTFLEFSGLRYWTIKTFKAFIPLPKDKLGKDFCILPSDAENRLDLVHLLTEDMDKAQTCKELLEEKQRRDRKLRQAGIKRRKSMLRRRSRK